MSTEIAVGSPVALWAVHGPREIAVVRMHIAKLLPLIGGEHATDGEGHLCIRLLKAGAGGSDAVDGDEHGTFIRIFGFKQRFELELLLLQGGVNIDELHATVLKYLLDLLYLSVIEADGFDDVCVLPPATGRKDAAHLSTWTTAVMLELALWALMTSRTTLGRLRKSDGAQQKACN
jgi:hypothetical protein